MATKPDGKAPSSRVPRKGRGPASATRVPASATRLAAVESSSRNTKKKPKVSYSTYVDMDTNAGWTGSFVTEASPRPISPVTP